MSRIVVLFVVLFSLISFTAHAEITSAGGTDRGAVRPQNEDSFVILRDADLYVVADGMGGHAAGEVASGIAVQTMEKISKHPLWDRLNHVWPSANTTIAMAGYHMANSQILQDSLSTREHRGMGTTMVSVVALDDQSAELINVGDSRGYLIHDHAIRQVTKDQSLVQQLIDEGRLKTPEEIESFPYKNIITQAMGTQPEIVPVVTRLHPVSGDIILLCSDGLTNELPDARILAIIESSESLDAAVKTLIEQAKLAGGRDNITAVLVKF